MGTVTQEEKRIVIEGDLVRLERTILEREVKTADFLVEIARMQPVDTGILPKDCVLLVRACDEEKRTRTIYVLERAPGLQLVRFNAARGGHETKEMFLSWPRTLWFCRTTQGPGTEFALVQDLWVTATRQSIHESGQGTALYRLPMPNLYDGGNGAICLGNLSLDRAQAPIGQRVTTLLDQVLESAWNDDLMPSFDELSVKSLDEWATASAQDAEFHARLELKAHRSAHVGAMLKFLAEHPG